MAQRPPYPFTAIVGQERMKQALILNAISSSIGGVLIRGERGTAKSTAARALAALLPEIEVVADCTFSCDPLGPEALCDNCRTRLVDGEPLPVARRRKAERARRKLAFIVKSQDLQRRIRVRRAANLVLFVVDASCWQD